MARLVRATQEHVLVAFYPLSRIASVCLGGPNKSGHDGLGGIEMVGQDSFIAVYMMANRRHGTIYVGVTSRLVTRALEHRSGQLGGFTARYGLKRLVWYEPFELMTNAIRRETRLKKYPRDWKINLIERENPDWTDLVPGLLGWRPDNPWGQPRP